MKEKTMLGSKDAAANIAVRDLAKARKFYEGTLGLKQLSAEGEEAVTYGSGRSQIIVYHSQYAGTNKATAATWIAGTDLEGIVGALKAKGVKFEHYDMPGMTRTGEIHVAGHIRAAWFRDPDGNILSIMNG
jgi:catechol 2,3-dioxygenase-like lactoylglutathione lyase family enzyme